MSQLALFDADSYRQFRRPVKGRAAVAGQADMFRAQSTPELVKGETYVVEKTGAKVRYIGRRFGRTQWSHAGRVWSITDETVTAAKLQKLM